MAEDLPHTATDGEFGDKPPKFIRLIHMKGLGEVHG